MYNIVRDMSHAPSSASTANDICGIHVNPVHFIGEGGDSHGELINNTMRFDTEYKGVLSLHEMFAHNEQASPSAEFRPETHYHMALPLNLTPRSEP